MTELDKSEAVARSVLGAELDDAECAALAAQMGTQSVGQGEVLVGAGETRRTLFVLAEGRISVCKPDGAVTLYQLRPGECAGTRAFLDASERKAMLRADTDSVVLTLEPEHFEQLIDTQPRLVFKVMRAMFRVTHRNLMRMNLESAELRNYLTKTGGRY
jgi:CRP/FNR family transcriptional regulator, cyclic AMP receptor protein